ncbi:MAG: toll/interleukin-1 receptor domain-containing protein [Patescibacteria group bacterium]|nr:toll/interleukin-1 receptor domain-containing protein [Patescibacteria group bacterium]
MNIPIEVFLSHADEDKRIARKIANALKTYHIKVFVAHDDIDAGDDWETVLIEKIKDCDIFLVLLSENFHNAHYTDHEVGIARGLNKQIVPIRIDNSNPYGFMSKFQAKKITDDDMETEIAELASKMASATEKGKSAIDKLIQEFGESGTFYLANELSDALFSYAKFSKEQINAIAEAFLYNDQIRGGFRSGPRCESLFEENWKKLDKSIQRRLEAMSEE